MQASGPTAAETEAALSSKLVVVKSEYAEVLLDLPAGPFLEVDVNSEIYDPLKRPDNVSPSLWQSHLQHLLVPTITSLSQ